VPDGQIFTFESGAGGRVPGVAPVVVVDDESMAADEVPPAVGPVVDPESVVAGVVVATVVVVSAVVVGRLVVVVDDDVVVGAAVVVGRVVVVVTRAVVVALPAMVVARAVVVVSRVVIVVGRALVVVAAVAAGPSVGSGLDGTTGSAAGLVGLESPLDGSEVDGAEVDGAEVDGAEFGIPAAAASVVDTPPTVPRRPTRVAVDGPGGGVEVDSTGLLEPDSTSSGARVGARGTVSAADSADESIWAIRSGRAASVSPLPRRFRAIRPTKAAATARTPATTARNHRRSAASNNETGRKPPRSGPGWAGATWTATAGGEVVSRNRPRSWATIPSGARWLPGCRATVDRRSPAERAPSTPNSRSAGFEIGTPGGLEAALSDASSNSGR
jgi:hypothetical protein